MAAELEIDKFTKDYHFPVPVFKHSRVDFLPIVKPVFEEYVEKVPQEQKDPENIYPGIMTAIMSQDERIEDFVKYVSSISWDILDSLGYDMSYFYTDASQLWGQCHPKTSSMEKHFHGAGSVLTGFYFLDTPENSSQLLLHDPKDIKTVMDLPVKQTNHLLPVHNTIFYDTKPGDLIFTNSWLSHSFTRNRSILPYNFIHINITLVPKNSINSPASENTPVVIW